MTVGKLEAMQRKHSGMWRSVGCRRAKPTRTLAAGWLAAISLMLGCLPAMAATFTVTRTDDPAPVACTAFRCSLREAVMAANASPGTDRIALAASTYDLTRIDTTPDTAEALTGPLRISESVEFIGAGATRTTVRWKTNLHFRNPLFEIETGTQSIAAGFRALRMTGGRGAVGGCVRTHGITYFHTLTLTDTVIESCAADAGGALYLQNTHLNLTRSILRNNSASAYGGAVSFLGASNVQSTGSELSSNSSAFGGAIRIWGNGYIGWYSHVVWVDDGSLRIANNSSGGDGGAIALNDTASLTLLNTSSATPRDLIEFDGNSAVGRGGAVWLGTGLTGTATNAIEGAYFVRNVAGANGGALAHQVPVRVVDSGFRDNRSNTGSGGAIAVVDNGKLDLERVSVHVNSAPQQSGGGIHAVCGTINAVNVSLSRNYAADGRGQGIETSGNATLRHVSIGGNFDASNIMDWPGLIKRYSTACGARTVRYANSLFSDSCTATLANELVSDGGNLFTNEVQGCPGIASDQRPSADVDLFLSAFDGPFVVIGWYASTPYTPQRNAGLAAYCPTLDARSFPRNDGACDIGAFEQQP